MASKQKEKYSLDDLTQYCRFCCPPDDDRILYQSEDYYTMLSLGPIVQGYSLIIPKQHITCFGMLPIRLYNRLITEKKSIEEAFEALYRPSKTVFFEHGNVGSSICKLPSDNHAHLHSVPIKDNVSLSKLITEDLSIRPKQYSNMNEFMEDYKSFAADTHYLLVEEDGVVNIYYVNDITIPSQYLRTKLAELVNVEKTLANWLEYPGWETIHATVVQFNKRAINRM